LLYLCHHHWAFSCASTYERPVHVPQTRNFGWVLYSSFAEFSFLYFAIHLYILLVLITCWSHTCLWLVCSVEYCAVGESEENIAVSTSDDSCHVTRSEKRLANIPPPVKKSRFMGDVDMNSPDVQKLIHAKSAHMSLADEVYCCWCALPVFYYVKLIDAILMVLEVSTHKLIRLID